MAPTVGAFVTSRCSEGVAENAAVQKPILNRESLGNLVSKFSNAARRRLENLLLQDRFDGVLQSEAVKDLVRPGRGGKMLDQLMVDMLPVAQLYAKPATSGFRVGAVCAGASGNIYLGANLELAGAPLGFAIHAEQSTINNALTHGEKSVLRLAVTGAPCGHCRQFLNELTTASTLRVLVAGKRVTTLQTLLPDSFGPADLGVNEGGLEQAEIALKLPSGSGDTLVQAALRAARRSYSPYTQSYSGVALQLKDGTIVGGSYLENAAYNPSLPPIIAAFDRLRFAGADYSAISRVVLLELENPKISQQGITRLALASATSGTEVRLVKAQIAKD